jgi:hypothetical protein
MRPVACCCRGRRAARRAVTTTTEARSPSKKIQGKPRKKACISLDSFGRNGAFQWVTANPNKKSGRASARVSGCEQNGSTSQASHFSGHQRIISKFLIFAKKNKSDPRTEDECLGPVSRRLVLATPRRCFNSIAFLIILIAIPCFCWRLRPLSRRAPGITGRKQRRRRQRPHQFDQTAPLDLLDDLTFILHYVGQRREPNER